MPATADPSAPPWRQSLAKRLSNLGTAMAVLLSICFSSCLIAWGLAAAIAVVSGLSTLMLVAHQILEVLMARLENE